MKTFCAPSQAKWPIALLAVLLLGPLQLASGRLAQAQEINCNAPQTQLEINICSQRDFEAADKALNAEYAKARTYMKSIDGNLPADTQGAAKGLLEAQRAWITYRDLACAAESFVAKGGTMEPMVISECKTRLTRQRTDDLQQLIAWD